MNTDKLASLVKKYSHEKCFECTIDKIFKLDSTSIKKLIPHREPFLLIDTITHIDFDQSAIAGTYKINSNDPILRGHFPTKAIYPGVLQIEVINQLGLCLSALLKQEQNPTISPKASGYVTRILHALFLNLVLPEYELTILVKTLESDSLKAVALGQLYHHEKLCSLSVAEVYFNE